MSQMEIEIILGRHWASHLNTPIFIVDPLGNLLYYNEPAEPILGRRFAETGQMPQEEWSTIFFMTDENRVLIPQNKLPLVRALSERQPVHMRLWLVGLDNVQRHIETTCFPLIGQGERFLGAMAIFWEMDE